MRKEIVNQDVWYFPTYQKESPITVHQIGITYPNSNYKIKRSSTCAYFLEFILSGKGTIILDGKKHSLTQGDVFLFRPNDNVNYYADKNDPFKKYWLLINGPMCKLFFNAYHIQNRVYSCPEIKELFDNLFQKVRANEPYHLFSAEVALVFQQICTKIYLKEHSALPYPDYIQKVKKLLDDNLLSNISLDEILNQTFIGKTTLIRCFKKYYGVTPHKYLLDSKLSIAQQEISTSPDSIKNIAAKLGFSDAYYFSNTFKKKFGCSPSEYRKQQTPKP